MVLGAPPLYRHETPPIERCAKFTEALCAQRSLYTESGNTSIEVQERAGGNQPLPASPFKHRAGGVSPWSGIAVRPLSTGKFMSTLSTPLVRRLPVAPLPRPSLIGHAVRTGKSIDWSHIIDWSLCVTTNGYRIWLIVSTVVLTFALYQLQNLLGAVPAHPSDVQQAVQWAELIWLVPVPLSIALWLGWLIFAEVGRPNPKPAGDLPGDVTAQVRLVVRIVTRGENVSVVKESILAIHRSFAECLPVTGHYRIEVVSDLAVTLGDRTGLTKVVVVPPDYQTAAGSLYKARALAYLQSQTRPEPGDWYLYLDEESRVDSAMLAGVYRFIARAHASHNRRIRRRIIGQGAILYQGGHWFFRGADGLRTADDLGRFRLQYALGMPLFGIHGSYIVVRAEDDLKLSFDVGPHNSITEDAAWALRAWARGYRFRWVEGYLHEQPPQHIMDFVRQRARWLSGIRLVVLDRDIPLRYRACLGIFTVLWQLAFLPFVVAIAALVVHIAPFSWMRMPADFAWAAFVLAYLQGAHVQATHPARDERATALNHHLASALPTPTHMVMIILKVLASWAMTLGYIWFALLEALGVLYSLKPGTGFFVIRKPSLTTLARSEAGRWRNDGSVAPQAPLESTGQRI